ncbi:MAG: cupredoxin domain-containing protein [Actinomycetota bacterium]|nr:cupredoxin domain-containing protein [Actinomycetota bacterium]
MRRRMVPLTLAVTVIAGVAAFVGPALAGGGCHSPGSAEETSSVHLSKACFEPTVTHVETGAEVAFINKDPVTHNVVGLGARWGEPNEIKQGEMRRFTFDAPGVYPYACYLHYGMVGAVVVGGDEKSAGDVGSVDLAGSSDDGGSGPGGGTAGETATNPASASDDSPWTAVTTVLLVALLLLGVALLLSRSRRSALR